MRGLSPIVKDLDLPLDPMRSIFDATWQEALAQTGIDAIEAVLSPRIRNALHKAWRNIALARDDPDRIGAILQRLHGDLTDAVEFGAEMGAAQFATAIHNVAYRLPNATVRAWAATRAGNLVTAISREVRAAIRGEVTRGVIDGVGPGPLSARIARYVGLTERDARAVATLEASAVKAGTPAKVARRAADEYAARLKDWRATTIARTELLTARNHGLSATWQRAQQNGLLPPDAVRIWLIADTERTCKTCMQMRGDRALAPVNGAFNTPNGPLYAPPMHPSCRCAVSIIRPGSLSEEDLQRLTG